MQAKLLDNRYKLSRLLGEGGMAKVYLGHDLKLDRPVAVKVLHNHMRQNKEIIQRFQLEAQAVSKLDHPNIVKVYDYSGIKSEVLWLVTEYIKGENLAEFLKLHNLTSFSSTVGAALVSELCKAVIAAHEAGIIHRDIKPENIMLSDSGTIKLMDFGIAKRAHRSDLTQAGTFMGSPSYMSPEQIRGGNIDLRSDIFSISILFYELVTGELPFKGSSAHEVASNILYKECVSPKTIVPKLENTLTSIIMKGLCRNPAERYPSARQLASAIDRFLKQKQIENSKVELQRFIYEYRKRKMLKDRGIYESNSIATAVGNSSYTAVSKPNDETEIYQGTSGKNKPELGNKQLQISEHKIHEKINPRESAKPQNWNREFALEKISEANLKIQKSKVQHKKMRRKRTNQATYYHGLEFDSPKRSVSTSLWGVIIALSIILITLVSQEVYRKMANRLEMDKSRSRNPIERPELKSHRHSQRPKANRKPSANVSKQKSMRLLLPKRRLSAKENKAPEVLPGFKRVQKKNSNRNLKVDQYKQNSPQHRQHFSNFNASQITRNRASIQDTTRRTTTSRTQVRNTLAPMASKEFSKPRVQQAQRIQIESNKSGLKVSVRKLGERSEKQWVTASKNHSISLKPGNYQVKIAKGSSSMSKRISIKKGDPVLKILVDF